MREVAAEAKTQPQAGYHRPVGRGISREMIPTKMCLLCPLQNFIIGIKRSPDAAAQVGKRNVSSVIR
jgi:hypothetical protein